MTSQSSVSEIIVNYNIRPMHLDDLDEVHEIDTTSFALPWPKNSYRYELTENKGSLQWIAEYRQSDGKLIILGMIVVWLIVDEAHIATLAVKSGYRGLGIGKRLLETALDESIQRKMLTATLEVRAGNQIAQNLYLKYGFKVVGRRPRYYLDNHEDAIIMTVDLYQYLKTKNI